MSFPSGTVESLLKKYDAWHVVLLLPIFLASACLRAQSSSTVELLGVIPATQVTSGLGYGLVQGDYTNEHEWAAIRDGGATNARIECPWSTTERQGASYVSGFEAPQYAMSPGCAQALHWANKYHIHLTVLATYNPPWYTGTVVTVPNGAVAGSSKISLAFVSGAEPLRSIRLNQAYFCPALIEDDGTISPDCGGYLSPKHGTIGTLITSTTLSDETHADVTLASALAKPIQDDVTSPDGCRLETDRITITCGEASFDESWLNPTSINNKNGAPVLIAVLDANSRLLYRRAARILSPLQLVLARQANSPGPVRITAHRVFAIKDSIYPIPTQASSKDTFNVAYAKYVQYLGKQCEASAVTCTIELWNEPDGGFDNSFNPSSFYDGAYVGTYSPRVVYALAQTVTFRGRTYVSLRAGNQGSIPAEDAKSWSTTIPATSYPGPVPGNLSVQGLALAVQEITLPAGVTAVSGATWNGANGSLLIPSNLAAFGGSLAQPATTVTGEVFHPYGQLTNTPEQSTGTNPCLLNAVEHSVSWTTCILPGIPNNYHASNMLWPLYLSRLRQYQKGSAFGLRFSVTETGVVATLPGQELTLARFNLRHFLGFQAIDVTPVNLFELWDGKLTAPQGDSTPGHFSYVTFSSRGGALTSTGMSYKDLAALMKDLAPLRGTPNDASTADLPKVAQYSGTYPLSVLHIVGRRSANSSNSDALILFQRSYSPLFTGMSSGDGTLLVTSMFPASTLTGKLLEGDRLCEGSLGNCVFDRNVAIIGQLSGTPGGPGTYQLDRKLTLTSADNKLFVANWLTHPSPRPVPVLLSIPENMKVTQVIDTVTRRPVATISAGSKGITVMISDNPVEILLDPR